MDSIYDLDNLEFEVTNRSMENELLEIFADEHLTAALRIVSTNILLPPDEKLIREAEQEITLKKGRVAIAYDKGGYQYITEDTNLEELG
jgi:hypothetical protein